MGRGHVVLGHMQIRLNDKNAAAVRKLKKNHQSVLCGLSNSKIVNVFLTAARKAKLSVNLT